MIGINSEKLTKIGKSISDSNRVEIIKLLTKGETCACELLEHFDITQPTLSHHMKQLTDSQLVKTNKQQTWTYYSINKKTFKELENFFQKISKSSNKKNNNSRCK